MKKSLLVILLLFGMNISSWACIDPNPLDIVVNMSVDTVNCDLLVEVTNLRIMGGDPNQFCSCSINDAIAGLGDVVYIVFVDSASHEPVIGFDQFALNALASDEWDLADPGFDWSGFVSDINSSGLIADQAVSLWIRIDLYATVVVDGFTFNPCEDFGSVTEFIYEGALGTDEWDNTNNVLTVDHQSIAYFYDNLLNFYVVEDGFMDYYDDIVNDFYSGVEEYSNELLLVYPNPVNDHLFIGQLPVSITEIRLIDALGQVVLRQSAKVEEINMVNFPPGIYHVHFSGIRLEYLTKLVKL